jgi:hypothetical protein
MRQIKVIFAVLAFVVVCGKATAEPTQYAVDGLIIGAQLSSDRAREYKCNPSDQFNGFTWCQKTKNAKDARGSYTSAYSILHSRDRNLVYVNRSQEPAFLNANEVESEIQRYSGKIGEEPHLIKMPHRGVRDGIIAVWGKISLEQLDPQSIRMLAEGKRPKKGLLIDFLGNFVQSAKEGLAIYRIDGGPGFVWAASFDQKGRGTLRLAAVNASAFLPSASPRQSTLQPADAPPEGQPALQPADAPDREPKLQSANASPEPQRTLQSPEAKTELQAERTELEVTVAKLQTELAVAASTITELEKERVDAQVARIEADNARIDAEIALEQAKVAEKVRLDAVIARLKADRPTANSTIRRWEIALYGALGGLLVMLTSSVIGFLLKKRRAPNSKQQIWMPETAPLETSGQAQSVEAEIISPSLSPTIVISESAFESELEAQVAAINAAQDKTDSQNKS